MKLIRSINWKMMAGPFFFCLTAYLLNGTFPLPAAFAVGTAVWMAVWWIFRPISIYVTAFVPIVVNSIFNLIPAQHVISQYFSEIAVLLLGADLICLTWTTTGLDQRISVKTLCFIGGVYEESDLNCGDHYECTVHEFDAVYPGNHCGVQLYEDLPVCENKISYII